MNRRKFLAANSALAAAAAVGGPFQGVAKAADLGRPATGGGYGPLGAVPDLSDGQVRLHLPEGFAYRSFNPAGGTFTEGGLTPGYHDGMGAFQGPRGTVMLVRNHEVTWPLGAFGDPEKAYDPIAPGGTSTLVVTGQGEVIRSTASLTGTLMNCSGGQMPWGSWVSCEETINGPDVANDYSGLPNSRFTEKHGYLFEVPVAGIATARPIRAAGRFTHESAAYDPHTGAIYLTEDNYNFASGFYRYLPPRDPRTTRSILDGGRLQMLAVRGEEGKDLSLGQPRHAKYRAVWVDIEDPDPTYTGLPANDTAVNAVGDQGRARGAALFARLEGCVYHQGVVYFVSTQGGATAEGDKAPSGFGDGRGQVWAYDTVASELRLVYESPGSMALDLPDNITTSPRGTLVVCEDGNEDNYVRGLTRSGCIFNFARLEPIVEDSGAEFAGSTFSPDGRTLFVNVQSKAGRSFAIWGPWQRGGF
ncbi:alkaline phosphatase PhoX [Streptomyces cyaneofuscatus]|uniref:alkaline phosphatase PhoX n=1 Tax=Streptomyces cyaneofuscatus TaxID=66883 RepID=UPI0033B8286A